VLFFKEEKGEAVNTGLPACAVQPKNIGINITFVLGMQKLHVSLNEE
jgi:hypothetical protein